MVLKCMLVVTLCFSGASFAGSNQKFKQTWIEKSAEYLRESNWDAAIDSATKALADSPRYDLAYVLRAWAYIESNRIEKALKDINSALEINPESGIAYNNRAYAFQKQGEIERAKSDYWTACDLKFENGCHNLFMLMGEMPEDIVTDVNKLLNYSAQKFLKKQWGDVIAASTQILQLAPHNVVALSNRSGALAEMDYLDRALQDSTLAIEYDENFAQAYHNRGYIYDLMGHSRAARLEYKEACKNGIAASCNELKVVRASK